ncbi:ABC transporter ATP-binding protein [Paenibacillus puldeungensis]|uniref:ABC transporter ATP-binding protein n=1 Tax=Paenibacillus puldeungensis TaxID=696536 RepID=A0ABW3S469_9BACL
MRQDVFLSVEGLSKRYKNMVAVDEISFSVYRGEVFGLLGPNGAGKTTTIKMLCGLLRPDSGVISYNGKSMSGSYNDIKSIIGLCPQEIVIWDLLTCMEQLKFVGMSYGLSANEAVKKADSLLSSLGLSEKRDKLAKTLSGGMQRRLNIALALVHDPEIIILDEPQAGLDPQSRILVRDFIRNLAKDKTVILTTHDMDEADRLSDRIAIVDHGKILLVDTPDNIKAKAGAGDILQVRVGADVIHEDLAEHIMQSLPADFTEKRFADGCFFLGAADLLELVPAVNQTLKAYHVAAQDMTVRKRTLEDAFIAMTGRGLRE